MHDLHRAWAALQAEVDSACSAAAGAARRKNTGELNQIFRRLRQYESNAQWYSLVCEAAGSFSHQTGLFTLEGDQAEFRCGTNVSLESGVKISVAEAQGFSAAIATREPVVAMGRASELGKTVSAALSASRIHVLPITNGERVVAVLIGGDDEAGAEGLELVAQMASAVLERQVNRAIHTQILAVPAPATPPSQSSQPPQNARPEWSALTGKDQELHRKAQRFARLTIARMQVAHPEACRAGREGANLYTFLRYDIDKARESFRTQFMTIPTMVDYLHLELVEQTASGDGDKLGVEYPGQLV